MIHDQKSILALDLIPQALVFCESFGECYKGESGDVRGKNFLGKGFMIKKQLVGLCSLVDSVESVNK